MRDLIIARRHVDAFAFGIVNIEQGRSRRELPLHTAAARQLPAYFSKLAGGYADRPLKDAAGVEVNRTSLRQHAGNEVEETGSQRGRRS